MIRNLARALAAGALIGGIGLGAMLIAAIDWTWEALAYGTLSGATVFVIVFAYTWLRTGWEIDRAIEDINAGIDVDRCYRCCQYGHNYRADLEAGIRVWICSECGERIVSAPGWADGGAA